jgi:hypothetical protein
MRVDRALEPLPERGLDDRDVFLRRAAADADAGEDLTVLG